MTLKGFYILLFSTCLFSCNSNRQIVESINDVKLKHIRFVIKESGFVELPLKYSSDMENSLKSNYTVDFNGNDSLIFEKDIHNIIGAFPDTSDYYAFLFPTIGDMLYPTIITFDKFGNQIDRQIICVSCCSGQASVDVSSCYDSVIVTKDLSITSRCQVIGTVETDDSIPNTLNICNERSLNGNLNKQGKIILSEIKITDCN